MLTMRLQEKNERKLVIGLAVAKLKVKKQASCYRKMVLLFCRLSILFVAELFYRSGN
jgi:hypothetical protein